MPRPPHADLDEPDPVLSLAQSFEDAVHAVAWKAEDRVNAPFDQAINQYSPLRFSPYASSRVY